MKESLISKSFYTAFVITMLLFTAGVCAGSAIAGILPQELGNTVAANFGENINPNRLDAFASSFINFFKPVIFIWFWGFFKHTFWGICGVTIYRGGIVGYFIGTLVKCNGIAKALLQSGAMLLPHYLLFLPVLAAASYFALKHHITQSKSPKKVPYFVYLALLASGCGIAALCDAYVSVFLIKLL